MPKVLIVDDEMTIIEATKSLLKLSLPDCEIITASSGEECIEKAVASSPDVILLDLLLPKISGFEVCNIIRSDEKTKNIPIIIMTGCNDTEVKVQSLTSGADAFISKPINAPELSAQIKAMIRIKQAEDLLIEELDYNRIKVLNSDQHIRKVYEASFEGIVIIADTKIISANKKFCSLYGYSYEEVVNKQITDFIIQGQHEKLLQDISNGCSLECEYAGINKDGRKLYFEVRQEIVKCDNKPAVLLVMHDITDLKRTEHRIESLLALSEKVFNSEEEIARYALDEAVRLTNSEVGYLHFVNGGEVGSNLDDVTLDLFVWSGKPDNTCDTDFTYHYPLKNAGVWADSIRTRTPAIHNNYSDMVDVKGYPTGHFSMTRHVSVPLLNGGNALVAIMGVGNKAGEYTEFDVHQLQVFAHNMWYIIKRKRLDLELKSYLDLAPTIFLALDRDGTIKNLNKFGREILECDETVVNKNWFDTFIPFYDKQRMMNIFKKLVLGKSHYLVAENEIVTTTGKTRIVSWRNTVLFNSKGDIETILSAGEDITDQRMAEKELENHWMAERIRLEENLNQLSILGDTIKNQGAD